LCDVGLGIVEQWEDALSIVNFDDFVKSPSAVRQAHGPEQSRRAVLRFIATTKITKKHEEKE